MLHKVDILGKVDNFNKNKHLYSYTYLANIHYK